MPTLCHALHTLGVCGVGDSLGFEVICPLGTLVVTRTVTGMSPSSRALDADSGQWPPSSPSDMHIFLGILWTLNSSFGPAATRGPVLLSFCQLLSSLLKQGVWALFSG